MEDRIVPLAQHKIFNNPELYDHLPPSLRNNRRVILNLLTKKPEDIAKIPPADPLYGTYIQTALVAAHFLHRKDLYQRLRNSSPELDPFCMLFEKQHCVLPPRQHSPLWKNLPFILYSQHANPKLNSSHLELLKPGITYIQNHFDMALLKVQQNGLVLQWLSPELQDNPNIVEAAIIQDAESLHFASARLQHDITFLCSLIRNHHLVLSDIDPSLYGNPEIIRVCHEVTPIQKRPPCLEQEKPK
jgi:hypothetical protein